ncbi:MAG: hypothetical protein HC830_08505 [Bacteroidetes bacterium]|nr:hypothetical protein [Bacteroidota bacterium]
MKYNLLICLFLTLNLKASEFKLISRVDSVKVSGFTKIWLSPDIISSSKFDYSDIRLFDSHNNEVPFLFKEEIPANAIIGFVPYPILENKYIENKKISRLVIHNPNKDILRNLFVIVRNTRIDKDVILKGSDDKRNWYIIMKGQFNRTGEFDETSERMELSFPGVNYEYLELTMNDKKRIRFRS